MTYVKKVMLTPCAPCVCPGAPCEQCMFGYQTSETNHDTMKNLLLALEKGERGYGARCAENYKRYHPDWKDQIKLYEGVDACKELEKQPTSFQEDMMAVLGDMTKDQAKFAIEWLWNKYFKED